MRPGFIFSATLAACLFIGTGEAKAQNLEDFKAYKEQTMAQFKTYKKQVRLSSRLTGTR